VDVQPPFAQNTMLATSVSPEFMIVSGVVHEVLPPLHGKPPPLDTTAAMVDALDALVVNV
jgi:hypothetical protein